MQLSHPALSTLILHRERELTERCTLCTSLGVKIGGGIGTAVVGWLLESSGYIGTNATQPQSALDMMQFMYLWLPLIFDVLIMFALSRMNVEDANKKLKAEKGIAADEVTDALDIN